MLSFWLILVFVFLGSILPNIIKWILMLAFKVTEQEKNLRNELRQLKKEQSSLSPVDEFAKYARLQRRINAVEEQVLASGQSRMSGRESLKWKWTKAVQIINGGMLVYMAYSGRQEPVAINLPYEWFWPLGGLLSYPTGIPGALSTVFWLFICNNASRSLIK